MDMDLTARGRGMGVAEVAHLLGKNRSWVHRAIARGDMPAYRLGRDYTVFAADLAAYVAARRVGGGFGGDAA